MSFENGTKVYRKVVIYMSDNSFDWFKKLFIDEAAKALHANRGGGYEQAGVGLNFEVVGGMEQPSNPENNTVWVETDQPITGWEFCACEPETQYEGMVWVRLGSYKNTEISIGDTFKVCVVAVYQSIDGVFAEKHGLLFVDGKWITLAKPLYVLKDGVVAMEAGSYVESSATYFSNGVIKSDGQYMEGGNHGYFSKKINVDDYDTLRVHIASIGVYASLFAVGLSKDGIVDSGYEQNLSQFVAYANVSGSQSGWVEIDISDLRGSYYFTIASVAYFAIDEIVLEPASYFVGGNLWGGKMVTGSFTLAQDSTSEYVIARAGDGVLNGLLNEGETFASIYGKLCLLVMRAGTTEFNAANYPGTMGAVLRIITKPYSYSSVRQYWNASGSSNTMGGGTTIDSNKIAITFQTGCAGSAAFTYNWVVWRHIP